MKISVLKENYPDEKRVASSPEVVGFFVKKGWSVYVESLAGQKAGFHDIEYEKQGAFVVLERTELFSGRPLVLKVRPPEREEVKDFFEGSSLISFFWPSENQKVLEELNAKKVTVWAMDQVPRITRAQSVDALSSMANVAGYRAVVVALESLGCFLGAQSTAAGSFPPSRVLVIGAGVAGLAALGAARSLGALVEAFDTRAEVKEQIQSMGAEFLTVNIEESGSGQGGYGKKMSDAFLEAEIELFKKRAPHVDIIISTALIPGQKAPLLLTDEVLEKLKPGSVVVDLASENGGNCSQTQAGKRVVWKGIKIIGDVDFSSQMAMQASQMYSKNILNFVKEITKETGSLVVSAKNEVILRTTVCTQGKILWPHPPMETSQPQKKDKTSLTKEKEELQKAQERKQMKAKKTKQRNIYTIFLTTLILTFSLMALSRVLPSEFMSHLMVFILSCFVGWQVIWNVTAALHTPLMSVTNAISGIIVIGALAQITSSNLYVLALVFVAIFVATINIVGGFWVTKRMLSMFRKEDEL